MGVYKVRQNLSKGFVDQSSNYIWGLRTKVPLWIGALGTQEPKFLLKMGHRSLSHFDIFYPQVWFPNMVSFLGVALFLGWFCSCIQQCNSFIFIGASLDWSESLYLHTFRKIFFCFSSMKCFFVRHTTSWKHICLYHSLFFNFFPPPCLHCPHVWASWGME